MLPTSIATVSLSGDLKEKLDAISAAGFDGVEIFENDFLAYPAGPGEVGRMVRDAGLRVTVFQPFRDFEGAPPLGLRHALEVPEGLEHGYAEPGVARHPSDFTGPCRIGDESRSRRSRRRRIRQR